MAIDTNHFQQLLEAHLAELRQLMLASKDSTKPVELDQQSVGRLSRMDAMQSQAMSLAVERRRQNELVAIEEAFRRIKSGDYGYCTDCGEEIAVRRLEINLTVLNCIICASAK